MKEKHETVVIDDSVLLIRISRLFHDRMGGIELYDATRGVWKLTRGRAEKAKYALSVYKGVVQEVYEIVAWFKAGSTFSTRRYDDVNVANRLEFVGNVASNAIREKYRNKTVKDYFPQGAANPVISVNPH